MRERPEWRASRRICLYDGYLEQFNTSGLDNRKDTIIECLYHTILYYLQSSSVL